MTTTTHHPAALDWVPVPLEVIPLGRSAVAAWCRLAAAGETLDDRPDIIRATVALDDLDLPETTARRAIAALEAAGLVVVDRAPGKASTYTLRRVGRWSKVPTDLVDHDAGMIAAFVVLDCAGPIHDRERDTTIRRLAAVAGVALRTFRRWLSALVKAGAVQRVGEYLFRLPVRTPASTPAATPAAHGRPLRETTDNPVKTRRTRRPRGIDRRPEWARNQENMVRPPIPFYEPPEPNPERCTPEQARGHIAGLRAVLDRRSNP